jgi:hypothetical protein
MSINVHSASGLKGQNRKAQGRAEGRQASSGALGEFPSPKLRRPDKGGTTNCPNQSQTYRSS